MRRKYKDSACVSQLWGGDALLRRRNAGHRTGENPAIYYLNLRSFEEKVYSRGNMSAQGGPGYWLSVMIVFLDARGSKCTGGDKGPGPLSSQAGFTSQQAVRCAPWAMVGGISVLQRGMAAVQRG